MTVSCVQISAVHAQDEQVGDGRYEKEYVIKLYGKTQDDDTRRVITISNYKPYFYVAIPPRHDKLSLTALIYGCLPEYIKDHEQIIYKIAKTSKMSIYGYTTKKTPVLKIYCMSSHAFGIVKRALSAVLDDPRSPDGSGLALKLFEASVDPLMQFVHDNNINLSGWLCARSFDVICENNSVADAIYIPQGDERPVGMANFKQLSWDIETYSYNGAFPSPTNKKNVCFQIGAFVKTQNRDAVKRILLTLHTVERPANDEAEGEAEDGLDIRCFETERDLLLAFGQLIAKEDPDILYTFNGDTFDMNYVAKRCALLGIEDTFMRLISRVPSKPARLVEESFSSSAYGFMKFARINMPGRLNYDLYVFYSRSLRKFESYKLDVIAKEILGGEGKHDVSPREIFEAYRTGDPRQIYRVGKYCVQDCELLQKIVDKDHVLPNEMNLAACTFVPMAYLLTRGQTIKVMSQIIRKAHSMGYIVPDQQRETFLFKITSFNRPPAPGDYQSSHGPVRVLENGLISTGSQRLRGESNVLIAGRTYSIVETFSDEAESFTGAVVLDPVKGLHKEPVAVMDFRSLYPSIIIAINLCFSSYIPAKSRDKYDEDLYETFEWEDEEKTPVRTTCCAVFGPGTKKANQQCGRSAPFEHETRYYCAVHDPLKKTRVPEPPTVVKKAYSFVKPAKFRGVLPSLLIDLMQERARLKGEMKIARKAGDLAMYHDLDGQQLAVKVSLNSVYGFCGRSKGNLVMKWLSATTTAFGRHLINLVSRTMTTLPRRLLQHYFAGTVLEGIDIDDDGSFNLTRDTLLALHGDKDLWRKMCLDDCGLVRIDDEDDRLVRMRFRLSFEPVYGDTDSVFIKVCDEIGDLKELTLGERLEVIFKHGAVQEIILSELIGRDPIYLEFEKVFSPLLLLSKKRYIGFKYESAKDAPKQTSMGIATVRRDYPPYLKTAYSRMIAEIRNGSIDNMVLVFKDVLEQIVSRQLTHFDVYKTGKLAASYKVPNALSVLQGKLLARQEEVFSGDRLRYVYIDFPADVDKRKAKKIDYVETPEYATAHGLAYNRIEYIALCERPFMEFFEGFADVSTLNRLKDMVREARLRVQLSSS